MSNSDGKIRYALGLFIRAGDVENAVKELCAVGLPLAQVKVIVPPVSSGREMPWDERLAALGADIWIVSESSGSCPWDFAPVRLVTSENASKRDVMPNFHIWALERHAQQLDRHLRSGGAITIVEVRTDAEERAAYSALLRHATAGVQTHEVSRHA